MEWTASAGWLAGPQRVEVARRLDAMTRYVDAREGEEISVREAAAIAGLSVARMYSMAGAWRKRRSVESLGVYIPREPGRRRRIEDEVANAAARRVVEMLEADASVPIADVVRAIAADGLTLSVPTVRRLVVEHRRRIAPGRFGSRLVLDSAGMDAVLDGSRMRLFVVLDEGTGLILGWADGTARSKALGLAFAVELAAANLPTFDLGGFAMADEGPDLEIRLPEDDVEGRAVFERLLAVEGVTGSVRTRRVGRALIGALGERLGGRIWLGAGTSPEGRSQRNGRPSRLPEYSGDLAVAVEAAIDAHNAERRGAAVATAAAADGEPIEEARARVSDRLRILSCAYDELSALPGYARSEAADDPAAG